MPGVSGRNGPPRQGPRRAECARWGALLGWVIGGRGSFFNRTRTRPPGRAPPRCAHGRYRYRRRARIAELAWLAWASDAMPLWFRMLYFVRFADSWAMLASRIRLSAAVLLVICELPRAIAKFRRFSRSPIVPCEVPSVLTAARMVETAVTAAA